MIYLLFIIIFIVIKCNNSFIFTKNNHHICKYKSLLEKVDNSIDDNFNINDYIQTLGKFNNNNNNDNVIDIESSEINEDNEQVYRVYPYTSLGLPKLSDCNNYYSGSYKKCFWHQNADQVLVYIPIDDNIDYKNDINIKFETKSIDIIIKNELVYTLICNERLSPQGSFWIIESDNIDKKYIQIDIEKRQRMINWKSLFQPENPKYVGNNISQRNEILQKLYQANTGMSKLLGNEPETYEEMLGNKELMKSINTEVNTKPQVLDVNTEDGSYIDPSIIEKAMKDYGINNIDIDPFEKYGLDKQEEDNDSNFKD